MGAGLKSNIVNVRVGVIIPGSADCDVEFPWQASPFWIATCISNRIERHQIIQRIAKCSRIDQFLVVNACKRTSYHISNIIECTLERGLVACVKTIDNCGCIFYLHAAELDIGASGDIDNTLVLAVGFYHIGVKAHLICIDYTIWHSEAHHKLTWCALITVEHSYVFKSVVKIGLINFLPARLSSPDLGGIFIYVYKCRRSILYLL
mmetsp:Transcript_24915/g.36569  ORF Transcript_24915/g.36569 Transcript_24915/m.36569 type:complete len:206 (+) Transcript_24915:1280-1897(+)